MILLHTLLVISAWVENLQAHNPGYDEHWNKYMKQYNKNYEDAELDRRREQWETNMETISRHNEEYQNKQRNYKMSMNEFSDMDNEEFEEKMTGLKPGMPAPPVETYSPNPYIRLPTFVDWRQRGAVTRVKLQGQCGSCYAFAATGSLEGQVKLKTGLLLSLSEQNIVDCSENMGCEGGSIELAFSYIEKNGGIDEETFYPYRTKNDTCRYDPRFAAPATGKVKYMKIESGNEAALQAAIATVGPVAVSFNAHPQTFQHYGGGVYDDPACDSQQINHAITAVGYGTENGIDYWLVKNNWGTTWGENGFVKLARNQGNLCGITTDSYFAVLS